MKWIVPKSCLRQNLLQTLRLAQYHHLKDVSSSESSYVRSLSRTGFYPRWHLYVLILPDQNYQFSLHLDQKQACYAGTTAHSGEYDDEVVSQEAQRINQVFNL